MEKIEITLDRYGNTSAASVPMALDEAVRSGRVREGDLYDFSDEKLSTQNRMRHISTCFPRKRTQKAESYPLANA